MNTQPSADGTPSRDRRATYVAVLLVEALVIVSLWLFSRHFGL